MDQWKCSECFKDNNLVQTYKLANNLFDKVNTKNVDEIIDQLNFQGNHKNSFVTTKFFMVYIEKYKSTRDIEIMRSVIDKCKVVLSTLSLLDPGCTTLYGKYMMILMDLQQTLLKAMMDNNELEKKDYCKAMIELARGKVKAAKLISAYID